MVERRSPKPNVEGSSPSWPVVFQNEVYLWVRSEVFGKSVRGN